MHNPSTTIIALATAAGTGAIAVLRLSGPEAITATAAVFKGKNLTAQNSHSIHFGKLVDGSKIIDEVLVSVFKAPNSYTGENVVEISCHGSNFIIQQIIQLFNKQGVRYAEAGEFTKRAFLNGKLDLAQAEAVADLIAAETAAAHQAAMTQMRGGFSAVIKELREQLIHFASMVELELDFAEEDVEFADRSQLQTLVEQLHEKLEQLADSFKVGNVLKNGIPTVIAGEPNVGKSTLLNALLNEEKAIVSAIAGTTRDFIEDELVIDGLRFRFTDTAGLRETADEIEAIGVNRARQKIRQSALLLYLIDLSQLTSLEQYRQHLTEAEAYQVPFLLLANKADAPADAALAEQIAARPEVLAISAKEGLHLPELKRLLVEKANLPDFKAGNTIVTSARHYQSLIATQQALTEVLDALQNGVSGDFLAADIRIALHHLGEITGEITTDDLLGNIFSKFCIGK